MSPLRILFSKNDLLRFSILLLVMLGGSLLEIASLGAVPLFVSIFTEREKYSIVVQHLEHLLTICNIPAPYNIPLWGGAILGALFLFRTIYTALSYALQEHMLANRHVAIASRLFRAYMNASYEYHLANNSSTALNNVVNEVENIVKNTLSTSLNLIRNGIILFTVIGLLVFYDALVSLGAFLALALAAGGFFAFTKKRIHTIGAEIYNSKQDVLKNLSEGLYAYKEAQILDKKDAVCKKLHLSLQNYCRLVCGKNLIEKCTWPFMELITCAVILGTMCVMLIFYREPSRIAQTIALVTVCLARLKGTITEMMIFSEFIRATRSVTTTIAKELQFLETTYPPLSQNAIIPELTLNHKIQFSNVSFKYSTAKEYVLTDLSFDVPCGTSVAFVGATGAGKSTIANLAVGLLTPTHGEILVDGTVIRSPEQIRALQNLIGYVSQDAILIDDTIRANIAFGIPEKDINADALAYAIATSQLNDFISSLADGLNTIVGERGIRLSGGQKQRIAIARALYRQTPLLVFDEATSALDVITEQDFTNAINALHGKHTIIVIAHRISTIRNCDTIFYLKNGHIIGSGTYDELNSALPDFNQMTAR